jgi:hypothetical protein
MIQQLLIAYLSLTVGCGPLLCCCTLRAFTSASHCCESKADDLPHGQAVPIRHHDCSGHAHHQHEKRVAPAVPLTQSSDTQTSPIPLSRPCPCKEIQERCFLAIPASHVSDSADFLINTWQDDCTGTLHCQCNATDLDCCQQRIANLSLPAHFENALAMLRAHCVLRC